MGSKKNSVVKKTAQAVSDKNAAKTAAEQKAAADTQAAAAAKVAADEAARVKEERDKAIRGSESEADVAAREQSTLANPKKQKVRGRRSLISSTSLGYGISPSRETLG